MQTPVEWLFEQIPIEWSSSRAAFEAFEQAKQMEKDHVMMAFNDGRVSGIFKKVKTADQYYKLTYKPETI